MNPIECPHCGEIELCHTRTDCDLLVYECVCGHEENQLQAWWHQENEDVEWIEQENEYDRNN